MPAISQTTSGHEMNIIKFKKSCLGPDLVFKGKVQQKRPRDGSRWKSPAAVKGMSIKAGYVLAGTRQAK